VTAPAGPAKPVIAVGVVLVAVAAGAALASTSRYRGELDRNPMTRVTLRVDRDDGDRVVVGFKVKRLLISCDGAADARLGRAEIRGEATVADRGRFKLKGGDPILRMAVKGKLAGKRRAHGTVRYSGLTNVGGEELECASGKRAWSAKR